MKMHAYTVTKHANRADAISRFRQLRNGILYTEWVSLRSKGMTKGQADFLMSLGDAPDVYPVIVVGRA